MSLIEVKITFTDDNGTQWEECFDVKSSQATDCSEVHRLAHILATDLKAMAGETAVPKHNATAWGWLKFPGRPVSFEQYFDVLNSQAVWRELATLIMGAEADLSRAKAYKDLEPCEEPPFEDDVAINDLYYIHDRKMSLMNQSVQDLIKVQDLVNRLLHESLGGDLVDANIPNWEKKQLTRENIEKRLKAKYAAGTISQTEFDGIVQALAIPNNNPGANIAVDYRNRLMHHMRPSVDYSMFFSSIESRIGTEVKDDQGKIIAKQHLLLARQPVRYSFHELAESCSKYLDSVVAMLDSLSKIELLRR